MALPLLSFRFALHFTIGTLFVYSSLSYQCNLNIEIAKIPTLASVIMFEFVHQVSNLNQK